jgi:hypothetical protein
VIVCTTSSRSERDPGWSDRESQPRMSELRRALFLQTARTNYKLYRSFERLSSTLVFQGNSHALTRGSCRLSRGRYPLKPLLGSSLPNSKLSPKYPPSPSNPLSAFTHVSHSVCGRLVPQFSSNNQQCLGHVQKTHKEGSSHTPTPRPAPNLRHSCCHSFHTSRASTGARSVSAR